MTSQSRPNCKRAALELTWTIILTLLLLVENVIDYITYGADIFKVYIAFKQVD